MSNYSWYTSVKLETIFDDHINVPEYQREYSWGVEEADDFFNDLKRFSESDDDEYLFGQFIFYKDKDKKDIDVIDGQQRLVTTVIFLSVARNIVSSLDIDHDSEEYTQFRQWVIKVIGSEQKEDFKLTLNGKANNYFFKNIQHKGGPENSGKYKAMKNIYSVYSLFNDSLIDYIKDLRDDEEKFNKIYKLINSLLQHFFLSKIVTEDFSQAYIIFETLNSRGKDLEPSDLLKNHFFHLGGPNVKDEWNEFSSILNDGRESITQFIRVYWNSKNELVRQRQVYRVISKSIKDRKGAVAFVEGLNKSVKYYLSMVNPNSYNEFNDTRIQNILSNLKILSARLYYPIIISCVEIKADNKSIYKLLKAVENLTVRNIILGPENANKFEKKFSDYALQIRADMSVDDVIEKIRSETSTDDLFERSFGMATIKDTSVSRYILASIYNYQNGNEFIINPNSSSVNVEHIMPRNKNQWPQITTMEHDSFLYYIGNQTLLKSEDNTSVSNDPFIEKKKVYSKSKIPQNSYFDKISDWNASEIEKRQKELFKVAVKCWPK